MQPFNIAAEYRSYAKALHPPEQVQDDARLVAFRIGDNDAGAIGVCLQNWTEGAVELGVHHRDMLPAGDGAHHDASREFDAAGHFQDHVDAVGGAQQHRIVGHCTLPRSHRFGKLRGGPHGDRRTLACILVSAPSVCNVAIGDGDQFHAAHVR